MPVLKSKAKLRKHSLWKRAATEGQFFDPGAPQ